MKPPCKNCKKRVLHCHSTCSEYIAFSNERRNIQKQKQKEALEYEQRVASIQRMQKYMKRSKKKDGV